jgi:two-component system sensor histidine kinase UhpB
LLFAVDMTAATIERLTGSGRGMEIPAQVRSIQDAVARMQRHVRMLLGRLRPIQAIGLEVAIERLTALWSGRRSDTTFDVTVLIEEDRIDDDLKETIYRTVQEGVSNAIRHGHPARVEIVIANDDAHGVRVEVSDDGVGMAVRGTTGRDPTQLGLIGMRERVMAMAGSLSIQHGRDGKGLAIVARLPLVDASQPRELGRSE